MYYILEHDIRPDGVINTTETSRSSLALALSYYYDRQSKLVVNTDFVSAHLMLLTERLVIVKKDDVETSYTE